MASPLRPTVARRGGRRLDTKSRAAADPTWPEAERWRPPGSHRQMREREQPCALSGGAFPAQHKNRAARASYGRVTPGGVVPWGFAAAAWEEEEPPGSPLHARTGAVPVRSAGNPQAGVNLWITC